MKFGATADVCRGSISGARRTRPADPALGRRGSPFLAVGVGLAAVDKPRGLARFVWAAVLAVTFVARIVGVLLLVTA